MGSLQSPRPVFIYSPSSEIVRKTSEASRPSSGFGFWLEQERGRPQATEGHCKGTQWRVTGLGPRSGGLRGASGGTARSDGSFRSLATLLPLPDDCASPLLEGRGSGPASFIWVASCQNHKRPISSARAFVFGRGCGSSREKPLFLQRIFRSAAGFWRPSRLSSPALFVLPCFPGHKQQMVLFTLEIRLCFSQSHRCPLAASGTV